MKKVLQSLAVAALMSVAATAHAIPVLQLYIDGATYDAVNETWVINSNSFDLWVLGDVGKVGPISNVFLSGSVYGASGTVGVTVNDPSSPPPPAPGDLGFMTDSQASSYFAGTAFDQGVSTHAEYADADAHRFWSLGDFTLTDSNIGDYSVSVPGTFPDQGQINVYHVEITGYDMVHFDAFDHYASNNHIQYVKAPFSHDATGGGDGGNPIPEPGTLTLLGTGLVGLAVRMRRRNG